MDGELGLLKGIAFKATTTDAADEGTDIGDQHAGANATIGGFFHFDYRGLCHGQVLLAPFIVGANDFSNFFHTTGNNWFGQEEINRVIHRYWT